jgi:hypothetical protein
MPPSTLVLVHARFAAHTRDIASVFHGKALPYAIDQLFPYGTMMQGNTLHACLIGMFILQFYGCILTISHWIILVVSWTILAGLVVVDVLMTNNDRRDYLNLHLYSRAIIQALDRQPSDGIYVMPYPIVSISPAQLELLCGYCKVLVISPNVVTFKHDNFKTLSIAPGCSRELFVVSLLQFYSLLPGASK